MDNASWVGSPPSIAGVSPRMRISSLIVALALALGAFVLVQHRAEAAPVKAAVATAGVAAVGSQAQIDVGALIRSIVCPILLALRNGPLGSLIGFVINPLLAAFGCTTSPG